MLCWLCFQLPILVAPPKPRPTSYGAKDFGAEGDGQTDGTKAIQAAFDAAPK